MTGAIRAIIAGHLARERNRIVEQEMTAAVLAGHPVETHVERLAAIPALTGSPVARATTDNPPPEVPGN